MAAHILSNNSVNRIRKTIDAATEDSRNQLPGVVLSVVNKDGKEIFAHASGWRGVDTKEPITLDSVFWIASCTKMIGGIAAMQLVEQGKLKLDDADLAEKLAPELKRVKILKGYDEKSGKPILVEKKNRITLRMLLSHTAGFGYSFFNPEIRKFGFPSGVDEFAGRIEDFDTPLLFEPGTSWNYGANIDWAGVLVERVSGLILNDYFDKFIFEPLGIKNISMVPSDEMKGNLVHLHQRNVDGTVTTREHLLRAPLYPDANKSTIFNSAGGGCFAQPSEYTKIIATLLNNGTSPTTRAQILKPETVEEMFSNQIPEMPDFARQGMPRAIPEILNPISELYPQPKDQPQGWGLTFMLTISPGATGRGANTAWWAGLPSLFWWADRERGVGGIIASQVVPFPDPQVLGLWAQVESAIYQG
ncbi:beta-lactamase/transpeptidase-like protein [Bisporella sp. PMI_857]|nr:beta-lactamase/transpeptidase-like protein [Bisporella sp. PMI_857]